MTRFLHGLVFLGAVGLLAAMLTRIALLLSLSWMAGLTRPFFSLIGHPVSGRDLILLLGGLFLLGKSTWEIHENLEGADHERLVAAGASFMSVIIQIMLLDIARANKRAPLQKLEDPFFLGHGPVLMLHNVGTYQQVPTNRNIHKETTQAKKRRF